MSQAELLQAARRQAAEWVEQANRQLANPLTRREAGLQILALVQGSVASLDEDQLSVVAIYVLEELARRKRARAVGGPRLPREQALAEGLARIEQREQPA